MATDRLDVLIASFGINILSLALPLVVLQVYDRVIPNASSGTLLLLVAGLGVAVLLDFALRSLRSNITTWASARFEHAITKRASGRLIGAQLNDYELTPVSVHLDRLGSIEALREFHSGQAFITVSDLPFVLLFIGLIWLIGGDLVWAPIGIVIVATVAALVIGARLDRAYRERTSLDDEKYDFLLQILTGMHTLKVLGAEAQIARRYEEILGRLSGPVQRVAFWNAAAQSLGPVLSNMGMLSVAAGGSILVLQGDMTGGALIASTLLAGRAVQPVIKMIGFWVQSHSLKLAEERLDQLVTLQQDHRAGANADTHHAEGAISMRDVTVHRGRPDHPVLQKVNLTVEPGEVIALAGPPGGGQVAFLDLIAGLAPPDEGDLSYDGKRVDTLDNRRLKEQIGYVREQAVLFRGTILDNLILFGDRERLKPALDIAHKLGLDEIIANLPDGLDTQVGDRASEALSRSVQQLITLTRTLGQSPSILLFDEANSALDMAADAKLRELLISLKGEVTIFMISSRPSLIGIADRVLRFDRGRVTEVNSPRKAAAADRSLSAPKSSPPETRQ